MASRRKGRVLAFQALYAWEASGAAPAELARFPWLDDEQGAALGEELFDFSRLLFLGTIENIGAVDAVIRGHLKNWDFSRVGRVDLAILRLSVYCLLFQDDVPPSIVIDEAIGLSKDFGGDDSFRFVNAVLDNIRKDEGK